MESSGVLELKLHIDNNFRCKLKDICDDSLIGKKISIRKIHFVCKTKDETIPPNFNIILSAKNDSRIVLNDKTKVNIQLYVLNESVIFLENNNKDKNQNEIEIFANLQYQIENDNNINNFKVNKVNIYEDGEFEDEEGEEDEEFEELEEETSSNQEESELSQDNIKEKIEDIHKVDLIEEYEDLLNEANDLNEDILLNGTDDQIRQLCNNENNDQLSLTMKNNNNIINGNKSNGKKYLLRKRERRGINL